jgi:molecular chaperone DnaJ
MHGPGDEEPIHPGGAVRSARELLGVTEETEIPELTRAYRRQARHLHPDVSSSPSATAQFQRLQAAYQIALRAARRTPQPAPSPDVDPALQHQCPRASVSSDAGPIPPSPPTPGRAGSGVSATGPESGVWIVAGPVHVHRARRSGDEKSSTKGLP